MSDSSAGEFRSAGAAAFPEARSGTVVAACLLGAGIVTAAVLLGRSFVFYLPFLALSLILTLKWRKAPRPWISLVSISAATPIAVTQQQFSCNLIFAFWNAAVNPRCLSRLPRWLYATAALAALGIATCSINWIGNDVLRNVMRQGAFAYNFFFGPFLLLPAVYVGLRDSRDHVANLRGFLLCLIVPSTVVLVSARLFGSVANAWEASMHATSLADGFLQFRLGKVLVNFIRTQVGFVLAVLICASTAIAMSQVRGLYRAIAGVCAACNVALLLLTGSFGSAFACFCGLAAIFLAQLRRFGLGRVLASAIALLVALVVTYMLLPESTKEYLADRYEHRVTNADQDRVALWARGVEHFLEHPEGVGFALSVGEDERTYVHNDYIAYSVSYGFFGGFAYASLVVGLVVFFLRVRRIAGSDASAFAIHLAGLGAIVALAVNGVTDHSNENRWYFNAMWSIIWYAYFCSLAGQRMAAGFAPADPAEPQCVSPSSETRCGVQGS